MSAATVKDTGKRCPDCAAPIIRFSRSSDTAGLFIDHEPTCPQWLARCAKHGVAPDAAIAHQDEQGAVIEMGSGGRA